MKSNLNLGSISGISIKIHWTFFLLLVWIIFNELKQGGTTQSISFNIIFILAVFFCVVLHELGHALTAKRFGIKTKKITLLPIGGLASLDKVPESPKQEFLVAIAGPLVNVAIAILLYFIIPVQEFANLSFDEILNVLSKFTLQSFLLYLFIVNVGLVIFNLIPAFPMDGGRIFRASLNTRMNRVKATQIASDIGKLFAILFLLIGLLFNPFLIFIALFIFLGAYGENKMVQHLSLLKGHKVEEAMMTNITTFQPEDPIKKVIKTIISGTENNFVVLEGSTVLGIVYHKHIIDNSNKENCLVKDIMSISFKTLQSKDDLKKVYELIQSEATSFFPVIDHQKFMGVIDVTNLNEYILLQAKLAH